MWGCESRTVWWGNAFLEVLPCAGLCEIKPGKEKEVIWGWRVAGDFEKSGRQAGDRGLGTRWREAVGGQGWGHIL